MTEENNSPLLTTTQRKTYQSCRWHRLVQKNIDAISTQGERYSIKTITLPNKTTGVFHGYGTPERPQRDKKFEYLIIVVIDAYQPELILELTWEDFYNLKRWHSTMAAYNISLSKAVIAKSRVVFQKAPDTRESLSAK